MLSKAAMAAAEDVHDLMTALCSRKSIEQVATIIDAHFAPYLAAVEALRYAKELIEGPKGGLAWDMEVPDIYAKWKAILEEIDALEK